jgi:hypothetical protein
MEEQHREGIAAGGLTEQIALGQHWQHDGSGRHRQPCPDDDGAGPGKAGEVHQTGNRRSADHDLGGAKAKDGAAHHP